MAADPTGPLRIFVCGRLGIKWGDRFVREADLPTRQGRRLWAYLVLHRRRPIGREALATAIWGEEAPDAWDVALNVLVSRVRGVLRRPGQVPAGIEGNVGRYQLHLPPGTFVDLERARLALHDAETRRSRSDPAGAIGEARVAMEIAGRGFLAGEEAPWIEGQRRHLADLEARAIECLAEAELDRDHPVLAEHEIRRLIELDPTRESAYRILMRALSAAGNRGGLAGLMAECRRALRDQAGTSPSPQTEDLFRRLLRG